MNVVCSKCKEKIKRVDDGGEGKEKEERKDEMSMTRGKDGTKKKEKRKKI